MNQLLSSPPAQTATESDLSPLLTAWDETHPATTDPDWRHLLDELAHPRTIQAFHTLATPPA
ncbi:hypothetical protein [Streptomyces sp. NRRL B-24085]|uniref:hypothetical protein n=1 Tax=Streptomyces sp. NRRL B-24085 TaxID=1709476 RepID=UPI0006B33058|nr:hypothetical protein [Streptomyces sp. NRRL B-24085]